MKEEELLDSYYNLLLSSELRSDERELLLSYKQDLQFSNKNWKYSLPLSKKNETRKIESRFGRLLQKSSLYGKSGRGTSQRFGFFGDLFPLSLKALQTKSEGLCLD